MNTAGTIHWPTLDRLGDLVVRDEPDSGHAPERDADDEHRERHGKALTCPYVPGTGQARSIDVPDHARRESSGSQSPRPARLVVPSNHLIRHAADRTFETGPDAGSPRR
jgi:hypothetical protein